MCKRTIYFVKVFFSFIENIPKFQTIGTSSARIDVLC